MKSVYYLLLALFGAATYAIPVDNGVEGDPEIECGPNSIAVNFNTRNPFEGHVFVKGLFTEPGCRNDDSGGRVAGITLPFDSCNVIRTRSLNPRGVFVSATVIISFHPQFITKVDRAYTIQCFYMEADKTVSSDLEVSMLTTGFQTQVVPMPICRYEILDGGPEGSPIRFALVGQPVYHKWTCDSETTDTFCFVVHSCFVDDGAGDRVDLLDENGCALDRYLLRNLEYLTDLMAGQETHVFKYADRPQLFFQCQITVTIKEPNLPCPLPQCSEPERGRRSVPVLRTFGEPPVGTLDVFAHLDSIDLEEKAPRENQTPLRPSFLDRGDDNTFCISATGFGLLIGAVITVLVSATVVVSLMCFRKRY